MRFFRPLAFVILGIGLGILFQRSLPPPSSQASASDPVGIVGSGINVPTDAEVKEQRLLAIFTGTVDDLLAKVRRFPSEDDANFFLQTTMQTVRPQRLAALAAGLEALPDSRPRVQLTLMAVARRWAKEDAAAALAWAQSLDPRKAGETCGTILASLEEKDSAQALLLLESLTDQRQRRLARIEIAAIIANHDPARAFVILGADKSPEMTEAIDSLFTKWGESDPQAALQAANSLPKGAARDNALTSLYNAWAKEDPMAALVSAKAITNPAQRNNVLSQVISTWSQTAPDKAWDYCLKLPPNDPGRWYLNGIINEVGKDDPTRAISLIDQLPTKERSNALNSLIQTWAGNDPKAAVAYVTSLTRPDERRMGLTCLGQSMDLSDPAAAQQAFAKFPAAADRKNLITGYLNNHCYGDPESCLALLDHLPKSDRQKVMSQSNLIYYLARQDQELAVRTIQSSGDGGQESQWTAVFNGVMETSIEKAHALIGQLPAECQRDAWPRYLGALANENIEEAMQQLQEAPPGKIRENSKSYILNAWASADPEAALVWARSASPNDRRDVMQTLIYGKVQADPEAAISVLNELVKGGGEEALASARSVVTTVGQALYSVSNEAAIQWAGQLSDETMKTTAFAFIANQWCNEDVVGASAWIRGLPQGAAKDVATQSLVSSIKESDPESACIWAAAIGAGETRAAMLKDIYSSWLEKDPVAGQQALLRSPLGEEDRASLLGNSLKK